MSGIDLGKLIGKVMGKIKKEEEEQGEEVPPDISATSGPAASSLSPAIVPDKVYLKALAINSLEDIDKLKNEVKSGNILVIRVTPLAEKDIDDVKRAVGELYKFAEEIGGDIARLGEDRIVLTPPFVKIWREQTTKSEG